MEDLFYLQDSRTFVGNDVVFWAIGGNGYTTDLRRAQTYSKEEAQAMHKSRPSDIPWPKEYIDGKTRPAVDFQYIKKDEALNGTGIVLVQPEKPRKEVIKCHQCGVFMGEKALWSGACNKCGADNRP